MMYVAFINVCFMLNALRQKFYRNSDLSRLCFEEHYRRKMATNFSHMSTTITEDNSHMCENCGNPVRVLNVKWF